MNSSVFEEIWDKYIEVWTQPDLVERIKMLKFVMVNNCLMSDLNNLTCGRTEIAILIGEQQQENVGMYLKTTKFCAHHNQSLALWSKFDGNGKLITNGGTFALFNAEFRIVQMNSFEF